MDSFELIPTPGGEVAVSRYGSPTNRIPVFYFHGFCGCRYEASFADDLAKDYGITLLSVDRPGFGKSPLRKGRTVIEWPALIEAVANHYGIDKFSIFGMSGGAPYVLATAHHLAPRVEFALVVSGMGEVALTEIPSEMVGFPKLVLRTVAKAPWMVSPMVKAMAARWRKNPEKAVQEIRSSLGGVDEKLLSQSRYGGFLREDVREALCQGGEGIMDELKILTSPWGFQVEEIRVPVYLLHGEADPLVPVTLARWMASRIEGSRLMEFPLQGHFFAFEEIRKILDILVKRGVS
jgi:pimeloyl-ACP methyl ester carboxylesterase